MQHRAIDILLVEDSPADVRLTQEALLEARVANRLFVVEDGVQALEFLARSGAYKDAPRPDLILLDLNLPRKDGREVLEEIKGNPAICMIPVIVLTTSQSEADILRTYSNHANCYLVKPVDIDQFFAQIRLLEDFWLTVVKLPPAAEVIHS